jgi:hypothetical protein
MTTANTTNPIKNESAPGSTILLCLALFTFVFPSGAVFWATKFIKSFFFFS